MTLLGLVRSLVSCKFLYASKVSGYSDDSVHVISCPGSGCPIIVDETE